MIGDDIVVTIVDIRGDKVRLGVNAPSSIPVHRGEVQAAIIQEAQRNAAAALQNKEPKKDEPVKQAAEEESAFGKRKDSEDPLPDPE